MSNLESAPAEFRAAWEAGLDRFGRVDGYLGTPRRR